MKMMKLLMRGSLAGLGGLCFVRARENDAITAALGASLDVTAETIEAVEFDGIVDAQVSLTVTNIEPVLALEVYVVFEDGQEVSVGDIAPGGSAASAPVTFTVNSPEIATRSIPVPVTLTFFLDEVFEESPATLVVFLAEPAGE